MREIEQIKENEIELVTKLALEYRLSLDNIVKICQVLQIKSDKEQIKKKFLSSCKSVEKDALKFLFNETEGQDKNLSKALFTSACQTLKKIASNKGNQDSLYKIDKDYYELINKKRYFKYFTDEELIIVMKYRVKYAFSVDSLCESLGISKETFYAKDKRIKEKCAKDKEFSKKYNIWLQRIEYLNDSYRAKHNASYGRQKLRK